MAYLLAAAPATVPVGPCTVLVDLTTTIAIPAFTPPSGFFSFSLPIPDLLNLLGGHLYSQVAVVDPEAPTGLSFTGGIRSVVGE
jgi:hypothetical protein